jgi:hypothetical protein
MISDAIWAWGPITTDEILAIVGAEKESVAGEMVIMKLRSSGSGWQSRNGAWVYPKWHTSLYPLYFSEERAAAIRAAGRLVK